MQKLNASLLRPGMLVGQDIYNEQGQALLVQGTALTDTYIDGLRARGFPALWVMDGIADDVKPPDILEPRVRAATSARIQSFFAAAQSLDVAWDGSQPTEEVVEEFASAVKEQVSEVYRDAENLVREVARAKVVSGVMAIKSYDNYTYEHSVEVAIAATLLGHRVGLEGCDLETIALGCLFHDLGKVGVPHQILNKPGKLTFEEFEIVKRHPEIGFQLGVKTLGEGAIIARNIVRQHHERQDGKGYAQGLWGSNRFDPAEKRPYGARMIVPAAEIAAVADVYSALASDRPYAPSMKPDQVVSILKEMAGAHLNRELVLDFLRLLPVYPVCSEVVVTSGRLRGYRGIVTQVTPRSVNRPVVRILFDPNMRGIAPFEVDTAAEKDVELAPPSQVDAVEAVLA